MFRWGAVFRNGVKLWKLRQWRWIRQYRIIWFRIPWIWAANHLALHESCLKGSAHTATSSLMAAITLQSSARMQVTPYNPAIDQ